MLSGQWLEVPPQLISPRRHDVAVVRSAPKRLRSRLLLKTQHTTQHFSPEHRIPLGPFLRLQVLMEVVDVRCAEGSKNPTLAP